MLLQIACNLAWCELAAAKEEQSQACRLQLRAQATAACTRHSMGSRGAPLAKMHLPWLHSYACSAVISAWLVGLDNGKISGRSTCLHSSSMASCSRARSRLMMS